MTRKRFIKLLMSRGYSRNEADLIASAAVSGGRDYEHAYTCVLINDGDPEAVEAARRAIERLAEAVNRLLPSILEAITAALPQIVEAAKNIQRQREEMTDGIIDA